MIAVLLLSVSVGQIDCGQNVAEIADEGAASYNAGLAERHDAAEARPHFLQAAQCYEQIWKCGGSNANIARNLAQSYLLAGDLGNAIRAYRLGLMLDPSDQQLRTGLAYAREQVQYPSTGNLAESCRPRERFSLMHLVPADAWHGLAALLYFLGCMGLARAWLIRRPMWWWFGGTLIALSAGMAVHWLAEENKMRNDDRGLAVVTINGSSLRRGNGDDYPLRLNDKLPVGVEVHVLGERGGWQHVQLAGGEIGWIEKNRLVIVE